MICSLFVSAVENNMDEEEEENKEEEEGMRKRE